MTKLNYITVGTNRLDEAKSFYDVLLGSIGMNKLYDLPDDGARIYGEFATAAFGVMRPYDGGAATPGNGAMCGFHLDGPDQVAAFHALALELGGSCEGPPGERGSDGSGYYFAYVRDLDGNKLCAYHVREG